MFQSGVALALVPARTPQGHTLIQGHVIPDFGGFTNHDTHPVINKETTPDLGPRVNFNPGQPAPEV